MLSRIPPWGTLKSQEMRWRKRYKTIELLKVVVFLLGKTKSFVRSESRTNLWEYQVCILHTLKDKMYHLYHVLRSRTLRSNVFTPCSRGVHSAVSFGMGTLGGWFACPRVMGSSHSWLPFLRCFHRSDHSEVTRNGVDWRLYRGCYTDSGKSPLKYKSTPSRNRGNSFKGDYN